jgi:hypothetical protein
MMPVKKKHMMPFSMHKPFDINATGKSETL